MAETAPSTITDQRLQTSLPGRPAVQPWRIVKWVAATFSLLVAMGLLVDHLHGRVADPLSSPQLKKLKEDLRLKPKDEALKVQIRNLDWSLRKSYFTQISRLNSGVYLLLAGVAVFLIAEGRMRSPRRQLPALKFGGGTPQDAQPRSTQLARWGTAGVGVMVGAGLFALSSAISPMVPANAVALEKLMHPPGPDGVAAIAPSASPEELMRNWPRFLGANAGTALATNTPVSWDVKSGVGVVWKVAVPAQGFNSPILWENRVFFSGGPAEKLEVFCLDVSTGALLWRQAVANVPGSPTGPLEIPDSTGYCAPTMATDGRRVYVMFADGDVAALSLEGKLVWAKAFGPLKNPYGHAISLATWKDRLILQLDQGESEDNKSKILALEGATGKVAWQTPRKLGGSWASPVVFESGGKPQVAALSVPWLISYSAADGSELWRAECLNGEVTPSPVFAGGLLYVISPSEKLMAFRADGQGDVGKTHVAWSAEDNVPDVTSPACNGEQLVTVSTYGMVTCYDAKTGAKQWEHELEMDVHSSPAIAGKHIYVFSQNGTALVFEAAREYKEVFRCSMGDSFHASPAFTPAGNIIVRGLSNVWCLGTSPAKIAEKP